MANLYGGLALLMGAHWVVYGAIYALAAASIVVSQLMERRLHRAYDEADRHHAEEAAQHARSYEAQKRMAPIGALEAIARDTALPAELRLDMQAEIARRKGTLN